MALLHIDPTSLHGTPPPPPDTLPPLDHITPPPCLHLNNCQHNHPHTAVRAISFTAAACPLVPCTSAGQTIPVSEASDRFTAWGTSGVTLYDADDSVASWVQVLTAEGERRREEEGWQPGVYDARAWDGSWRVKYAPHIRTLSTTLLSTRFDIVYHIRGREIVSNVRYSNALLGKGWLNASGSVDSLNADDSEIVFEQFWVDGDVPQPSAAPDGSALGSAINRLGALGFVRGLSRFPVLWLDDKCCVFSFPPLGVNIATVRE